jgi:hypothetical protein
VLQLKLKIFRDYFENHAFSKSHLSWSADDFKFLINNFDGMRYFANKN